ncbi:MAG: hypothetical protein LBH68_07100, partial [Bifidobacteriaceae bacterium]|nr:hypothetical protein [Bifidobacteriaceae bacterium]
DHEYRPPTGYGTNAAVYAVLSSDPTKTDSDGDGYGDKTEATWDEVHHSYRIPDPMVSDVQRYDLSNPAYVSVGLTDDERQARALNSGYRGTPFASYGGDQSWFYQEGLTGSLGGNAAKNLSEAGCGVIAFVDLVTYLGSSHPWYPELADPIRGLRAFRGFHPLTYGAYYDFVYERMPAKMKRQINTPFVSIDLPAFGITALGYENMVDAYFASETGDRSAGVQSIWLGATTDLEARIRRNIGADLPMTFLTLDSGVIGFYRDWSVQMISPDRWVDRDRDGDIDSNDYASYSSAHYPLSSRVNPGDSYYDLSSPNAIGGSYTHHFVNVTGYIEDRIDGKTKLTISSWGGKHVVEVANVEYWFGVLGGVFEVSNG